MEVGEHTHSCSEWYRCYWTVLSLACFSTAILQSTLPYTVHWRGRGGVWGEEEMNGEHGVSEGKR